MSGTFTINGRGIGRHAGGPLHQGKREKDGGKVGKGDDEVKMLDKEAKVMEDFDRS